ncbi:hypothetical protein MPTK1_2g12130 [Marchantia polymorpha subsp. ruderalis]|uniref:Uncharacterized protein n=1 Tax=Marchantia polymorpha TaxID=3197 RepID=A0A2R6XCQ7_MARPO|nr:hypothetical protein MARPO_0023s0177 [Marchantia polymorpha]BBN02023.1 hypothetical protein Mp_2g12130 [Marchantia polymorpha subsp. ruderalis]|eukprot:PTQ43886.1 hypothetical protein MARPO_0023s0177 [Marchantia polymorpha]
MALYQRELDRSWSPPIGRRRYTKSGFGTQIISHRVSSPAFGFGSSARSDAEKMYINAELAKQQVDKCSPGPQYDALSSFGKQPKSINENPPEIHFPVGSRWFRRRREEEPPGPGTYNRKSGFLTQFAPSRQRSPEGALFGTSTRKQRDEVYLSVEFDKAKYGTLSPGPSAYGARSTFGPQCSSPNRTAPLVGFIHDKRFKYHLMGRPGETTGPGQYDQKGSIGKQNEAYKDTLPAFSFGNCTRDNANKVFISMEHDKINYGIQSPGPAVIKLKGCMGKQPSSRNRNPAFVRFGKGLRWQFSANDAPGPGSYDC